MKKTVDVVAGVIFDPQRRLLACSRPAGKSCAGKWEFPGGKVEKHESYARALERELIEELALGVTVLDEMYRLELQLPDKVLVLHFIRALTTENTSPVPQEDQQFRWLGKNEIFSVDWLETDREFVEFIARSINTGVNL